MNFPNESETKMVHIKSTTSNILILLKTKTSPKKYTYTCIFYEKPDMRIQPVVKKNPSYKKTPSLSVSLSREPDDGRGVDE